MDKIAGNTSVQKPGALLHAVGIGSLNRLRSGPRLFYLKFRI